MKTLDLLLGDEAKESLESKKKLSITDDITEWDYGTYGPYLPCISWIGGRADMRSRKRASPQLRSRLSEPSRVFLSGTFGPWGVPEESEHPFDYPKDAHGTLLTRRLRSPSQVQERLDRLIGNIKKIQEPFMHGGPAPDILIVAHGHILRAFTKRWLVSSTQA